ncbi:hypothetical protein GNF78_14410, partial [Clostridium perfringens]
SMNYNRHQYHTETVEWLARRYRDHLIEIIRHCCRKEAKEVTPTDYQYKKLTQKQLDSISQKLKKKL